jgi:subtilisin family serine protease
MDRTLGIPEVVVGLIDGPVALDHPDLAADRVSEIPGRRGAACSAKSSAACIHGTFVAGVLTAKRGSVAPAICPGCRLLVRPIFPEHDLQAESGHPNGNDSMPSATPDELAEAVLDAVNAGARVLNISAAIDTPSTRGERTLEAVLDYAARRGVLVVVASGNQGALGSTAITRHPWVIPVVGCDVQGRPTTESNLGSSIGRHGLRAPGHNITSLGTQGKPLILSGTSAAAPFVTGALALLCSEFPDGSAAEVKLAITQVHNQSRNNLVPPLLNASAAYERMAAARKGRSLF